MMLEISSDPIEITSIDARFDGESPLDRFDGSEWQVVFRADKKGRIRSHRMVLISRSGEEIGEICKSEGEWLTCIWGHTTSVSFNIPDAVSAAHFKGVPFVPEVVRVMFAALQ